jgi:hypothetical protein
MESIFQKYEMKNKLNCLLFLFFISIALAFGQTDLPVQKARPSYKYLSLGYTFMPIWNSNNRYELNINFSPKSKSFSGLQFSFYSYAPIYWEYLEQNETFGFSGGFFRKFRINKNLFLKGQIELLVGTDGSYKDNRIINPFYFSDRTYWYKIVLIETGAEYFLPFSKNRISARSTLSVPLPSGRGAFYYYENYIPFSLNVGLHFHFLSY